MSLSPTLKHLAHFSEGPIHVDIWGHQSGFTLREANYYRWTRSTKEPGKWVKVYGIREVDQHHHEKLVKRVTKWFEDTATPTKWAPDYLSRHCDLSTGENRVRAFSKSEIP